MKLLAGVEEVSEQSEKQPSNDESRNNNHDKQSKTDVTQETIKLLTGEVNYHCRSRRCRYIFYIMLIILYTEVGVAIEANMAETLCEKKKKEKKKRKRHIARIYLRIPVTTFTLASL